MDPRAALQQVLGSQYAIERELGGGGMSRVFLATERALDRLVAIKLLAPELAAGVNRERFAREVLLSAQLQHPNIITVLATGIAGELPYYIMPYIEGESLRTRLERHGALPVREVVPILRDVARALAYAHGRGVVHRDIKPDNVLLAGGAAMVTDFGVAKALAGEVTQPATPTESGGSALTALGTSLGTIGYMAPEQAAADPATDHRADLYAFGAMAYELLAGRAPFAGLPPRELLTAIVARDPAPLAEHAPGTPPALCALVHRCLAKDPAERPQRAEDISAELEGGIGTPAASPRRTLLAGGAAALLLLLLGAGWLWRARAPGAPEAPPNSLAVLPLSLPGADSGDAYFADGITEELTIALSHVPSLRVASSSAVFALRGAAGDPRALARRLGVAHLLSGSVRRGGGRVRVAVQLTSAGDGLVRWADSYEREMRDVFQVQEEVSRAIAAALQVAFEPGAPRAARTTTDTAAYDLYLKGRFHWRQRGEPALRLAAREFGQAIARDSGFAPAWAGLADALGLLPVYGTTPADSVLPLVEHATARAIALDSTLAEAHAALGQLYRAVGRWPEAQAAFARATAADSSYAPAHQWSAELELNLGRPQAAVAAMRRAIAIDPTSPIIAGELGYMLALTGDRDSALAMGREAMSRAPELWTGAAFLGTSQLWLGAPREAVPLLEEAMRLAPRNPFGGVLAFAVAAAGDTSRARHLTDSLATLAGAGHASPTTVAIGYAGVGERQKALDWLDRAVASHDGMFYSTPLNAPWFSTLWNEPRFRALAHRVHLDSLPPPRGR